MTTDPTGACAPRRRRATSLLALFGTTLVALAAGGQPAGAVATTALTDESFTAATTSSPDWTLPAAGTNRACLTAGSDTAQLPVRACSATPVDAAGSGTLRLTSNLNGQVGNVYNAVSLPTAQGLNIAFDTFQYDRDLGTSGWHDAGADGISFILAATDPENPAPPTTQGATGGSLGYSSSGSTSGVSYGYLGFGIDVYGNFTNGDFSGSDCTEPNVRGGQNVAVRGPGHGTSGYCLLTSAALVDGDLDKPSQTTRPSAVPVEIALNPSTGTVVTAGGISVPPTSYALQVTPYLSPTQTLIGALPAIGSGLGFPSGWVNPTTGVPYQLSFGWGASTGGSNEIHEIGQLQTVTLNGQLPVLGVDIAAGSFAAGSAGVARLTPRVSAGGGSEGERTTVTTTFPSAITPQSGSFTTANGYTCTTTSQVSACRYLPPAPIAPGGSLPALDVPVSVGGGVSPGTYTVTAKVSSIDGRPATAQRSMTVTLPPPGAPTSLAAVPDNSKVTVTWQPPTTGQPAARYRVTASPGSATCTTTGLSCVLGGVAGTSYTITVVPIAADGVEGTPATTTTAGSVAPPAVPPAPPADAPLTLTTTDGPITTAEPGQRITVIGTGFLPYSTVTIVLYSTPVTLGTVTTDGTGAFSKLVTVPTSLAAGSHSLVAYGVDPSGNTHSLRMDITVPSAATAARSGRLAFTGTTFDPLLTAAGGGALLLIGALVLLGARSRRPSGVPGSQQGAAATLLDRDPPLQSGAGEPLADAVPSPG